MTTIHVTPIDDLIEHELSDDCVCGPSTMMTLEGEWIIIHESLDRREDAEE